MMRVALLACLFLAGCSSLPERSDYYETQYRGVQALGGESGAFDRLSSLQQAWAERSRRGPVRDILACEKHQARAESLADGTLRVVRARDAILSQRELTEVMVNALADLESEYDALAGLLAEDEASVAMLGLVAEQKYLARRMANSLVLMAQTDMNGAVEAADLFGRDVARFQALLESAINGDDELGIDPPDNPEIEDSLAQIEELFTGYVADSTGDQLNNVAYRYDAWLALAEMAALGDGRKQKAEKTAAAGEAADAAPAESGGGESADDAMDDDGTVEDGAADSDMPAADDMAEDSPVDGDEAAGDADAAETGVDEAGDEADMDDEDAGAGNDMDAGFEDGAIEDDEGEVE